MQIQRKLTISEDWYSFLVVSERSSTRWFLTSTPWAHGVLEIHLALKSFLLIRFEILTPKMKPRDRAVHFWYWKPESENYK